jgi:peptidoglycan hydrolase CwlO-like protein
MEEKDKSVVETFISPKLMMLLAGAIISSAVTSYFTGIKEGERRLSQVEKELVAVVTHVTTINEGIRALSEASKEQVKQLSRQEVEIRVLTSEVNRLRGEINGK